MTARKLVEEVERHLERHPEAVDFPVRFLGRAGEEWFLDGVARVVLDVRDECRSLILDGES